MSSGFPKILLFAATGLGVFWLIPDGSGPRQLPASVPTDGDAAARDPAPLPDLALPADPPLAQRALPLLRRLVAESMLAGTEADGGFPCRNGVLLPDQAVRRRFDYYANLLGKLSPEEIGMLLVSDAVTQCGPEVAAQVSTLWRAYRESYPASVSTQRGGDAAALREALAAARRTRREKLGEAWAQAFFGAEETLLEARLKGDPAIPAAPESLPDASRRLEALKAAWAEWDGRIAAARSEIARLRSDTQIDTAAQQERIRSLIEARFSGAERLRAMALLNGDG